MGTHIFGSSSIDGAVEGVGARGKVDRFAVRRCGRGLCGSRSHSCVAEEEDEAKSCSFEPARGRREPANAAARPLDSIIGLVFWEAQVLRAVAEGYRTWLNRGLGKTMGAKHVTRTMRELAADKRRRDSGRGGQKDVYNAEDKDYVQIVPESNTAEKKMLWEKRAQVADLEPGRPNSTRESRQAIRGSLMTLSVSSGC